MIDIKFTRPPPGATAEERASAYADALIITERALKAFQDELSHHTEQLLIQEINAKTDRARSDERFEHVEEMLEAVLRSLQIDPKTLKPVLPPMRDRVPTADDIGDAVEHAVERAIDRKTPATAFQVPGMAGPWHAPIPPVAVPTRSDVKDLIENDRVREQRDELAEKEKSRGDMWRNIAIGAFGSAGAVGICWMVYQFIQFAATHAK